MIQDQPPPEVLDLAYLSRQTLGDRALQGELLALFDDQCARLIPVITTPGMRGVRLDAAHTLKGAARAIGAGRVAEFADRIEDAIGVSVDGPLAASLACDLEAAAADVRRAIAALGGPSI